MKISGERAAYDYPSLGRQSKNANQQAPRLSTVDDLRADPAVGEDFKQEAVREPPVNEVHALHPFLQGTDRTHDLGPHSLVDHTLLLQLVDL